MIYLLNGLDSSMMFYILIILLILVVIAIFYLVYTQHREMIKVLGKREENVIKSSKDNLVIENTMSNVELPIIKDNNNLEIVEDKKEVISEVTDREIPNKFDYTQALWQKDEFDLEALSQELEGYSSNRKSIASKYEEEQEEQAIISYDELIRHSNNDNEIVLPIRKKEYIENNSKYAHEEKFLNDLKSLNSTLK